MPCTFSCGERFPWGELTLELAVEGGVCRHAAVWTDAMDESFAQPLARGLEGCPFRVEDLCRRVEETPACREVAADLCALLRRQDI